MYRLVVSDIDGTLIGRSQTVADNVLMAIDLVRRADIRFTLATGRRRRMALPVARSLGLDIPFVAYDGAAILDPVSGDCAASYPLTPDLTARAVDILDGQPGLTIALQDDPLRSDHVFVSSPQARSWLAGTWPAIEPDIIVRSGFAGVGPPCRLLAFGTSHCLQQAAETMTGWPGRIELYAWGGDKTPILECYSPGIDKGFGFARLCDMIGVPVEQAAAVGDEINDLPMLKRAGLAVAMKNSHSDLFAVADATCGHVDEDGMEGLLLNLVAARTPAGRP